MTFRAHGGGGGDVTFRAHSRVSTVGALLLIPLPGQMTVCCPWDCQIDPGLGGIIPPLDWGA